MKRVKLVLIFGVIALLTAGLWGYWRYSTLYPATRDAYLRANIIIIAAEETGKVANLDVTDNAHVSAGDPLFELDDATYRNAVEQAAAQVTGARVALAANKSAITAARAQVVSARAAKTAADGQSERAQTLFDRGDSARSKLDDAKATAASAAATLDASDAALTQAKSALEESQSTLAAAEAGLATAKINLARTRIVAPADGWVADLDLRAGGTVTAYQPLFALIDPSERWVDANFKETDLPRITEGQPVQVTVDLLPGR